MSELIVTFGVEQESVEEMSDLDAAPEAASFGWRQRDWHSHFPTSGDAVKAQDRMIEVEPGVVEHWLAAAKLVANGLLWTSVLLAACLMLTWLTYLVLWGVGVF